LHPGLDEIQRIITPSSSILLTNSALKRVREPPLYHQHHYHYHYHLLALEITGAIIKPLPCTHRSLCRVNTSGEAVVVVMVVVEDDKDEVEEVMVVVVVLVVVVVVVGVVVWQWW